MVKNSLKNIGKGASLIIIGIIIANILSLTNQILLGRLLGPANYGLFNLGLSVLLILSVFPQLGLGAGLTQFIPYNLKKNNFSEIKESINIVILFTFLTGILVGIFFWTFSDYLSMLFNNDKQLSFIFKIFSICLPFSALFYNMSFLTRAFQKPKFYIYIENISFPVIQIFVFLILFHQGYGLLGAVLGVTISSIISALAYLYIAKFVFCKKNIENSQLNNVEKKIVRKELFHMSIPLFLAGFSYLFMQYTDKIILGVYLSPSDVGIYSAALALASVILFIYTAFSFNFRSVLAGYFALNDFDSIKEVYSTVTKWIYIITLPTLIYLTIFSKDIITLIFGNDFSTGYIPLCILALGLSFNGLTGLSGESLIAMKHPKLNLMTEIVGAVSNVLLNLILIPIFGIFGAALGTALSIILRNVVSLGFISKKLMFNPYNINYLKILLVSFLSFAASWVIYVLFGFLINFIIIFPIFIVIYFILICSTNCLDENDKFMTNVLISFLKSFLKIKI